MQHRSDDDAALTTASAPGAALVAVAWAGALLFGVSLTCFLYAYLVRYGEAAPGDAVAGPIAVDTALFSLFALHHSLFARTALKARIRQLVPPALERTVYTVIASVLFLIVCWWWVPVPGELYSIDPPWRWLAWGVQAAGVAITVVATRALDALDLAGVRAVLRARSGEPERHVPLSTSGVYAIVRHPLYFGWALLVFGAPHMTATRLVFAIVSTAYLAVAIPWEERALVAFFGPDYAAYRLKVRWRMIPGVY